MIKIREIEKLNLRVSWTLLYLGFCENSTYGKQLLAEDIIEYAIGQLDEEHCADIVYELAGTYVSEKESICNILEELMESEDKNKEIEERKIRAVIVSNVVKYKNNNYLDGLMDLSDLWIGLGYPKDSPHIFQSRNNNISVEDYYNKDNYDMLFERNICWLNDEILYLQQHQD